MWKGSPCSEDWANATAISKAFSLGKLEATAVSNLQTQVSDDIVRSLKQAVAIRGMRSFLGHDILSRGLFNVGFSSASGSSEAWAAAMTVTQDSKLVLWSNEYGSFVIV